jgi:peptidyl-prolyl cis-trans isomerase B (cyclophilin B)
MFRSLLQITPAALVLSVVTASFAFGADPPATKVSASAKGTAGASDEVAVLETTKGKMVIEFWDKEAPKTVANFKKLARQGFYDGTGFHRIIKGFMVQGGDPKSKNPKATDLGTGDPGYKIDAEFTSKKHVPGVISMARGSDPNSAGSQFFLMHGAAPSLDGQYTAFGRIIEGMNVLNDIAATPVTMNPMMNEKSKPAEWTTLKSVKIVSRASLAKATPAPAKGKSAAASLNAAENKKADAAKTAETSGSTTATEKKASDTGTTEAAPPASSGETSKPDSVQGQGSTGHEGHGH